MRLLNATARFGPEAAQDALGGADLRHETHHILSFARPFSTRRTLRSLLRANTPR